MSALRAHTRHFLTLLVLVGELLLLKRPPGGDSNAPSSRPDGADGTGDTPSPRRGNIDAGKGFTSAIDATSGVADAGTPTVGKAADEDTPAVGEVADAGTPTERPNQWTLVEGSPPPVQTIHLSPGRRIHIMDGDGDGTGGGHFPGSRVPFKHEFPERWLPDDEDPGQPELDATIVGHILDIARNPDSPPYQRGDRFWVVNGTRDGVDITVIIRPDGTIWTAYPTGGPGVTQNDEHGNPHPLDE